MRTRYAAAMQGQLRWWLWIASALACGCSDARLLDGFGEGQTRLRVVPDAFVGDVPCVRDSPGGLQHYVVQLQELPLAGAPADAGPAISVSPPTPCDRAVVFPAIPGRAYAAEISGFDVPASEVASAMPRWLATCGRGSGVPADAGIDPFEPTIAVGGATVPLRGCTTFAGPPALAARLRVDVQSALGTALRCGGAPGEVAFVEGVLESQRRRTACDQELVFDVADPGRFHSVALTGLALLSDPDAGLDAGATPAPVAPADAAEGGLDAQADADPGDAHAAGSLDGALPLDAAVAPEPATRARWQTRCLGRSAPGVTSTATCDPFVPLAP